MSELWSYEKVKRLDRKGRRWHFVTHDRDSTLPYEERPWELYFHDEERKEFGCIRFERRKENPCRNYDILFSKIMDNPGFRKTLLDPSTKGAWRKRWK